MEIVVAIYYAIQRNDLNLKVVFLCLNQKLYKENKVWIKKITN